MAFDDFLKVLQAPVNFVREKLGIATGAEGDAMSKGFAPPQAVMPTGQERRKRREKRVPPARSANIKNRAVAAGAQAKAAAGQVKKKKMGLFSKKKVCESCGQKLEPSWDQCPYCGAGGAQANEAAIAAPAAVVVAQSARTMALDTRRRSGGTDQLERWLAGAARRAAGR